MVAGTREMAIAVSFTCCEQVRWAAENGVGLTTADTLGEKAKLSRFQEYYDLQSFRVKGALALMRWPMQLDLLAAHRCAGRPIMASA